MAAGKKLGERLIDSGLLDESQLRTALADQRRWQRPLGVTLVKLELVDEAEMLEVLARQLDVPVVRIGQRLVDRELLGLVPYDVANRHQCLPLYTESKGSRRELYVGMADPTDLQALDDLAFRTGMAVHPVLVGPVELDDAIERLYRHGGADPAVPETPRELELEDGSAARGATERRLEPPRDPGEGELEILHGQPAQPPASRTIVRALVQLLIDRGVISRDELAQKIRETASRGG